MRHIEAIKSVVLLLLVILSITFTFSIWSYAPKFKTIDSNQAVEGSVTNVTDKRPVSDIVLPYKWVFKLGEDDLLGTTDPQDIEPVLSEMMRWKMFGMTAVDQQMTPAELDALLKRSNQYVLYYPGEVPIGVYKDVLEIEDKNVPEVLFNRLIVNWNPEDSLPEIHFVSTVSKTHYKAKVKMEDTQQFQKSIIKKGKQLGRYKEVPVDETRTLTVADEPLELDHATYIVEEINPSLFKDALFNDPNAVRRNLIDTNTEEYGDDHAFMNVNTKTKVLRFVYPPDSQELAIPSELMSTSIEFVNDHNGWTDDYRYSYMNPVSRYIQFQLYDGGLPVFSDIPNETEITEILGDNRIHQYIRPYYTLNSPIKTYKKTLPAATEVAKVLQESDELDATGLEEIKPGYLMFHDTETGVMRLEPYWFYYIKGNWEVFKDEQARKGGGLLGLE
ncbi:YycH family regulatory protein [Sporosarcina trichiuri]|uniref:YycH family regulatory protein n=1 Tax=Sporosarcina trichiuri TaxID=3056445 RepID=UPI0025B45861|nr:two-component system activity regulator YycH [Sporosarcina sp. 0.2-SM1T-5]WJY26807.1 two-component system activity regulator YycH [Sporosarcina sp. 0.2-SM1T-5]